MRTVEKMTDAEVLEKFGVTDAQLDAWEKDAADGVFHGAVRRVVAGRPRIADEPLRAITVTLPESMVESIDERSGNRSAFIRKAVAACL
jgi:hypothetical protein